MLTSLLRRPGYSSLPTSQRLPSHFGSETGFATPAQALASLSPGSPAHRGSMFRQSLDKERQATAARAANFAAGSPLPMTPVQSSGDVNTMEGAAPKMVAPSMGAPGMMSDKEAHEYMQKNNVMGIVPKDSGGINYGQGMPLTAPTMEYNGAYGRGPAAQRQAEAARSGFISQQNAIANPPAEPLPLDDQLKQAKIKATDAWTHEHEAGAGAKQAWTNAYPGQLEEKNKLDEQKVTQQGDKIKNDADYHNGLLKNGAERTTATERMGTAKNQNALDIAGKNNKSREGIAQFNAGAKQNQAQKTAAQKAADAQHHEEIRLMYKKIGPNMDDAVKEKLLGDIEKKNQAYYNPTPTGPTGAPGIAGAPGVVSQTPATPATMFATHIDPSNGDLHRFDPSQFHL